MGAIQVTSVAEAGAAKALRDAVGTDGIGQHGVVVADALNGRVSLDRADLGADHEGRHREDDDAERNDEDGEPHCAPGCRKPGWPGVASSDSQNAASADAAVLLV